MNHRTRSVLAAAGGMAAMAAGSFAGSISGWPMWPKALLTGTVTGCVVAVFIALLPRSKEDQGEQQKGRTSD